MFRAIGGIAARFARAIAWLSSPPRAPFPKKAFILEPLEPRLLFSADPAALFLMDDLLTEPDGQGAIVLQFDAAANAVADSYTLRLNGENLELLAGTSVVLSRSLAATSAVVINGEDEYDDTLTVDFDFGGFFSIAEGITFNGGANGDDTLIVGGGGFTSVDHIYSDSGPGLSGSLIFDDGVQPALTIAYTDLEPLINTGNAANLIFTLTSGNDQAVLEDDGVAANGMSRLRSLNGTFETTTFSSSAAASLTINMGNGNDSLEIASLPDFTGSLTINGGGGGTAGDTVNFTGTSTFSILVTNVSGAVTDSAAANLTVTNEARLLASSITLGDTTETINFARLGFTTPSGAVNISEDSDMVLVSGNGAGSLRLVSTGSIGNLGGMNLTVVNNASFSGSSINLGNAPVDLLNFGSLTFNSPGAVSIAEDSAMHLAGSSTANSLALASTGSLTDSAAQLSVMGNATFTANPSSGPSSITLAESAGESLTVGIAATFTANGGITVGGAGVTELGLVNFNSAGAVSIHQDGQLALVGSSAAGSLSLGWNSRLVDVGGARLTVSGDAHFEGLEVFLADETTNAVSVGGKATFDVPFLTFDTRGTVNFGSLDIAAEAVFLAEDSDTVLEGLSSGNLMLFSGGSITDVAGASVTVDDFADFTALSIALGDDLSDTTNFGSLTLLALGAASISEDSHTVLNLRNFAQSLNLVSAGSITDAAGSELQVVDNARFAGSSVTLGDDAQALFGTLTFDSPGAVSIREDHDLVLGGASVAGELRLETLGFTIADAAGATLTVAGDAAFVAGGINLADHGSNALSVTGHALLDTFVAINVGAPGDVRFGSLTFDTMDDVAISEDGDMVLTGSNAAQNLVLNSGGSLTDAAGTQVTVGINAAFTGASIDLADNAGDDLRVGIRASFTSTSGGVSVGSPGFTDFFLLNFNSAGAASITQDTSILLVGNSVAGSLTLTSSNGGMRDTADGTSSIRAGDATLTAADFIGGSDATALTTDFTSLTATARNGVYINEVDTVGANGLTLNLVSGFAPGAAFGGDVWIRAAGSLIDGNGAGTNLVGAAATLSAGGSIGAATDALETDLTSLTASSGTVGAGGIFISEVSGSIALGTVNADGGAGAVEVSAAGGQITTASGGSLSFTAGTAVLDALDGISLNTGSIANLQARNTTSGNVSILGMTGPMTTVGTGVVNQAGSTTLATSGTLTVASLLDSGRGNIALVGTGGVVFDAAANLQIDIGGAADFTQVVVSGPLTLGGTLDADLVGGFSPAPGSSFPFMTFISSAGDFDATSLPPDSFLERQATGLRLTFVTPSTISIGDASVTEGNTGTVNAIFNVTLSSASTQTVTVNYSTADGTAGAASDYTAAAGTLTFAPGEISKQVSVEVTGDGVDELDEVFMVNLSNAVNASIAHGQATGTILDDDTATVSISDVTVTEGDSGATLAVFTLSLSNPADRMVSVDYRTVDVTATGLGVDYASSHGAFVINAGETSATFAALVIGDTIYEADETFRIELLDADNAVIADPEGVFTILNDDPLPSLSIANAQVTEGNSGTVTAAFDVTLSSASPFDITVDFATADLSASVGSDYDAASGTLMFLAGQTTGQIFVTVNGDTADELTETFSVTLSNALNANIAISTGVGAIFDDDPTRISISDVQMVETDSGNPSGFITITLSTPAESTMSLGYRTVDGTARGFGIDYVSSNGGIPIFAGETTKTHGVTLTGDTIYEGDEFFFYELTSVDGPAVIEDGLGRVTILDDDPAPGLSIGDVTAVEGDIGTVNAVFTVSLSAASGLPVTVSFLTADGTASTGSDYEQQSAVLEFAPGETSKLVSVVVNGDLLDEPNETFTVALSDALNASIVDAEGVATIVDDDEAANHAPVVDAGADQVVGLQDIDDDGYGKKHDKDKPEAEVSIAATFEDADLGDTHTATIDWGDGQVTTGKLVEPNGAIDGTVKGKHAYNRAGEYTVTVTVRDDDGNVHSDTLVITVKKPIEKKNFDSKPDDYKLNEDTVLTVNAAQGVLANDRGPAGATLAARLVEGPDHGKLLFNADGSFTYIPDRNFHGKDSFWYEFTDLHNVSHAVEVELKVKDVKDKPAYPRVDWDCWYGERGHGRDHGHDDGRDRFWTAFRKHLGR